MSVPRPAAARQLVVIFAVAGALALVGAAAPGSTHVGVFVGIGVFDLLMAGVAWILLRRRAPAGWVLALGTGTGLPVIAVAGRYDAMPSAVVFVVLAFVWVGANFPPRTSWWLLPPAAAAYLYAVEPEHVGPGDWIPPLLVVIAGCVIVAETIARSMARLRAAEARSRARAAELRTLVETAVPLNSLDTEVVLDTAVEALLRLGHDAAAIALLDRETGRLRLTHSKGPIPASVAGVLASGDRGVTGRALRLDATVVETDYQSAPDAVPAMTAAGFRTVIATPVHADDGALGVLFCASLDQRSAATDPEAIELLAAHVGRALRNASDYARQEVVAAYHASRAAEDPLTGLYNRRHAQSLLAGLEPGDTVFLFDLDYFKGVNDAFGHAVGDQVLKDFAQFLRDNIRHVDDVARMGGDEFMVIWRAAGSEMVEPRLVELWRATHPRTTVSGGHAVHTAGRTPRATLEAADAALYAAKRQGRDREMAYAG